MATKKSKKAQVAKREQEPRKGIATADDLESKAMLIAGYVAELKAMAKEFREREIAGVSVDGWQKFKRATTELKEFCASVRYFMAIRDDTDGAVS